MTYNKNEVILSGNLTRDAELAYTKNGKAILKFSIAFNEKPYTKDGHEVKEVSYFDVVAFGDTVNDFSWLTKGARVTVTGRLKQDRWEKDGKTMSRVNIIAFGIDAEEKKVEPKVEEKEFPDDIPF